MFDIKSTKVRDLVTNDYRTAAILERHSIDFCCNGGQTIATACAKGGVDPATLVGELEALRNGGEESHFRPAEWGLDILIDHIIDNHHRYVARMIPVLEAHLAKIVSVHGSNHPELNEIGEGFRSVASELSQHMLKEERVLFPYIKGLVAAEAGGRSAVPPPFGTIRNPIRMMETEHESAGNVLFGIRKRSGGYSSPADGCTTYQVTYRELEEFEKDLHQHIHLENNVLFPRAIELEMKLLPGL
jgi:regulator of cell morphogenesis and NO signaling